MTDSTRKRVRSSSVNKRKKKPSGRESKRQKVVENDDVVRLKKQLRELHLKIVHMARRNKAKDACIVMLDKMLGTAVREGQRHPICALFGSDVLMADFFETMRAAGVSMPTCTKREAMNCNQKALLCSIAPT